MRTILQRLALLGCSALCACTTVTPLQTASTVDPGTTRLGAQASISPYCSISLSPQSNCSVLPAGAPLPELRGSARFGLTQGLDLGASAHLGAVVPQGISFGLSGDAKKELWSAPLGSGRRQLFALSAGAGLNDVQTGLWGGTRGSSAEVELPLSAWYGYQLAGWELVASPRFVERLAFVDIDGDRRGDLIDTGWVGLTASAITRGRSHLGLSLDYLTPTGDLLSGVFSVSVGGMWDLGGSGDSSGDHSKSAY